METVLTRDGSRTLRSVHYHEHYHSLGGAFLESEQLYFKGCGLHLKAESQKRISVLDIGFGLGYNVFVAVQKIREVNPDCRLEIVSFEQDPAVFSFFDYPVSIRKLALTIKENFKRGDRAWEYKNPRLYCRVLLGDAREGVKALNQNFDAVFLDPFSPPKNPELWTVDFFKALKRRMKHDAILATYSIATAVIAGLCEAGLFPEIVQGTATKRYALIAGKERGLPLPEPFLRKLKTSPEREPFRDPSLTLSREAILKNRQRHKTFHEPL